LRQSVVPDVRKCLVMSGACVTLSVTSCYTIVNKMWMSTGHLWEAPFQTDTILFDGRQIFGQARPQEMGKLFHIDAGTLVVDLAQRI
jgi:hypothetical protein